ncbi:wiskott-Aldrich syndrome protein homolog 1-like [Myotis myotis]|uniref:wiskott-Aldrich syndrome protein homolog 1-like n=1 Tax=Myotis myotis TaxID=51298 RepID=UPI00174829C5|nr:wiskott-Aldrich syndrome protein homolog 1-like [Myotis myotis]
MRCSCRFIILGAGWRRRGHRGGRGPAAPGPAACARSALAGRVGGALRFLGQRAPAPLAPASPLAAPPSAPRSLLSASLGSRSPRLPGSPRPLAVPESVGPPSAPSTGVCAAPPGPPHPVPWREAAGTTYCVQNWGTEDSRASSLTPGYHRPAVWEVYRLPGVPTLFQLHLQPGPHWGP